MHHLSSGSGESSQLSARLSWLSGLTGRLGEAHASKPGMWRMVMLRPVESVTFGGFNPAAVATVDSVITKKIAVRILALKPLI